MKKLFFLYDKLITNQEQTNSRLPFEFVSFAQLNSKMYWLSDGKRRRVFTVPPKRMTTNLIYGGLFVLKDYEHNRHKLHSYYNNSMPYTGGTMIEDLYDLVNVRVTPIKFSSLKNIVDNVYVKGEAVECSSFFGNLVNKDVCYCASKPYHRQKGVDMNNFIRLIKDQTSHQLP